MPYLPQPHASRRATRVRLLSSPATVICLDDGHRVSGKLQTISLTGGLLRLTEPIKAKAPVEIMFLTDAGPVLGVAEMLPRMAPTLRCLQPFRFLVLEDDDYRRLHLTIESLSDLNLLAVRSAVPARPDMA